MIETTLAALTGPALRDIGKQLAKKIPALDVLGIEVLAQTQSVTTTSPSGSEHKHLLKITVWNERQTAVTLSQKFQIIAVDGQVIDGEDFYLTCHDGASPQVPLQQDGEPETFRIEGDDHKVITYPVGALTCALRDLCGDTGSTYVIAVVAVVNARSEVRANGLYQWVARSPEPSFYAYTDEDEAVEFGG